LSPLVGLAALASAADGGASFAVGAGCSAWAEAAGAVLAAGPALAALGGAAESAGTTALNGSSMCTGGVCTVRCAAGVGGASAGRGFERPTSKPPTPMPRITAATAARFPRLVEGAGGAVSEASSVV
jgi:hypothetical protein